MNAEPTASDDRARGLRAHVYAALPPSVTPTGTACQPLHRHVLDKAEGDVIGLTKEMVATQFGDEPHVVLILGDGDLDPTTDAELTGLLDQTRGGVLVFGVSYSKDQAVGERTEPCPECGAMDAFVITGTDVPPPTGAATALLECRDCGAVWDA